MSNCDVFMSGDLNFLPYLAMNPPAHLLIICCCPALYHGLVCLAMPSTSASNSYDTASLELNIHQQILSDIASNVGETQEHFAYAVDVIESRVQTRVDPATPKDGVNGDCEGQRVFMVSCELLSSMRTLLIVIAASIASPLQYCVGRAHSEHSRQPYQK